MPDTIAQHARLGEAIAKVCPVLYTRGKGRTMSIEFAPHATDAQKDAARALVASFDWDSPALDQDSERIKTILAKADVDITAGELKELVLKFVRKRI